jgi:hypothetical protein
MRDNGISGSRDIVSAKAERKKMALSISVSYSTHVIHKLQECGAGGTLIVPEWSSSYLWPFLSPNVGMVSPYIRAVKYLNLAADIFITCRGQELI